MVEKEQMGIVPKFNKNMRKMRKTRLSRATLVAATLVVAGYGGMKAYDYSYAKRVNRMSRLMMENVEALTTDGEEYVVTCSSGTDGACYKQDTENPYHCSADGTTHYPCIFDGSPMFSCTDNCDDD